MDLGSGRSFGGHGVALETQMLYQSQRNNTEVGKVRTECDTCERREDRLRREVGGAEVGGRECQDFKGETFGFDHYEAGEGEADHGDPVVESWVIVRMELHLGRIRGGLEGELPLFVKPGQQLRPATKRT